METKFKVGITGGIGSGKTFVCRIIRNMGYPIFFSDKVSKQLLVESDSIIVKVKSLLGEKAYNDDGTVDSAYISKAIFSDKDLLKAMNAIMHPAVRSEFKFWTEHQKSNIVFNEAAILFETNAYRDFDKTILITSTKETKISRIIERDNISIQEIEDRMKFQWEDEQKIPLADYIINNDNNSMILPQIDEIISDLKFESEA